MGLFDFISRPLRGIGRLARGLFDLNPRLLREGVGDVGAGAKAAAPILGLTGVGMPLAAAIGAAGGLAERGTAPGAEFGDVLTSGVTGAAGGAAGAAARGALGLGRAAGAVAEAPGAIAPNLPVLNAPVGIMPSAAAAAPSAVAPALPSLAASATPSAIGSATAPLAEAGMKGATPRGIGRVLSWIEAHPTVALGGASTLANIYGAEQQGSALDRELALREEESRARRRPRVPYDEWAAERERLRGRYGYGGGG